MNAEFILGESKYIDFAVSSKTIDQFVIVSAGYELKDDNGEVITSGQCDIDGHTVSALITPSSRGRFILEINYSIPPEQRKARVLVNVI
ncbi:MAG: hypothetical protein Q8865_04070 [Bacillota bacterium]|nr:hypothetical protein [Bacillota bacterium]